MRILNPFCVVSFFIANCHRPEADLRLNEIAQTIGEREVSSP
jgi:hypothetical protein